MASLITAAMNGSSSGNNPSGSTLTSVPSGNLPQHQRVLRETLLQYNAMQLGNFVLLSAKEREALAERETIEALRDYWITRARLERAIGSNFNPPTDSAPPRGPG